MLATSNIESDSFPFVKLDRWKGGKVILRRGLAALVGWLLADATIVEGATKFTRIFHRCCRSNIGFGDGAKTFVRYAILLSLAAYHYQTITILPNQHQSKQHFDVCNRCKYKDGFGNEPDARYAFQKHCQAYPLPRALFVCLDHGFHRL